MGILKVLREQSAIGFNGRVVFREAASSRHLGNILIYSGSVVGCTFGEKTGKKALVSLFLEDFRNGNLYDIVVEPEVIDVESFQFEMELFKFEEELKVIIEKSEKNKKLKPPPDKRLLVNPDFVCRGDDISSSEFDLMCTISDFGKVSEIYKNSNLLEFEITDSLISLRKKGAIKVLS